MPGRHQQLPSQRVATRLLTGSLSVALAGTVAGAALLLAGPATATPTPNYHAGSDTATFAVTGVLDHNCPVSTGGAEVWIKPGDSINFDSSAVGINVKAVDGLFTGTIGQVAGLNVAGTIDAGTKQAQAFTVVGGKTTKFTNATHLAAGDHTLTWTAKSLAVLPLLSGILPGLGSLTNVPLSSSALGSGASLKWAGVIHVTTNAPQCKLGASTPKIAIAVGPVKATVPPLNVNVPVPNLPTLPGGGSGGGTPPGGGGGGGGGTGRQRRPLHPAPDHRARAGHGRYRRRRGHQRWPVHPARYRPARPDDDHRHGRQPAADAQRDEFDAAQRAEPGRPDLEQGARGPAARAAGHHRHHRAVAGHGHLRPAVPAAPQLLSAQGPPSPERFRVGLPRPVSCAGSPAVIRAEWCAGSTSTPGRAEHLLLRSVRGRSVHRRQFLLSTPLRHYEVMVILDPSLEERTIAPSLDTFLSVVKKDGGSVEKLDIWGKRRMAYEIDKHAEGIYAVIDLQAAPASVQELDRQLNLNESVLRTKVLRPDER